MTYEERKYRIHKNPGRFIYLNAMHLETDLHIGLSSGPDLKFVHDFSIAKMKELRSVIEAFILEHSEFRSSFHPLKYTDNVSYEIATMLDAAEVAGTGPMAAVAGLFSQEIGRALIGNFDVEEVVIENGGDIYAKVTSSLKVNVFAGNSPLSSVVNIKLPAGEWGICTSSGTVGHSISLGKADALCIVSESTPVADALATALANRIHSASDMEAVLELSEKYKEITGILIIVGDKLAMRGQLELC